mgnify:FL=1
MQQKHVIVAELTFFRVKREIQVFFSKKLFLNRSKSEFFKITERFKAFYFQSREQQELEKVLIQG